MCGIAGFGVVGGVAPATHPIVLRAMCDALIHRGPDDQGTWAGDGVGLGCRRLSIIDLESGHQPQRNEDGRVWIVMNGEIFNHLQLRAELGALGHRFETRSDTEAVVHAYEEWGDTCVERLNGQFAFAIWDRRRQRMFLARDRVGIKPLYYRCQAGALWFASEMKALLCDPSLDRRVDPVALHQYLTLEYIPSPRSIIAGIAKLPPGHTMTWDGGDGAIRLRQYWDVDLAHGEAQPAAGCVEDRATELRRMLKEAVHTELISDVPVGVFLSGGIDSSAVAAMMTQLTPGHVNSFSVGFRDPSFDESGYAREVARVLDTTHRELVLEPAMLPGVLPLLTDALDEPFADPSIIPTYLLARFAREHVKVALGGDGGDELFAGYPTLQAHRLAGSYQLLPRALRERVIRPLADRLPVSLDNISLDFKAKRFVGGASYSVLDRHLRWLGALTPEAVDQLITEDLADTIGRAGADVLAEHAPPAPLRDPLNQVLYLDMKLYLEGDILAKLDRASMLASLEARVPLLNVAFVEHVAALPLADKLRGLQSKYLLRRALRGLVPDQVLRRRKKGFGIPVARWLQGPLRDELLAALGPDRIRRDGFFRPAAVQALVDDHLRGRRDNRKPLWTLFMFQRWHERFAIHTAAQRRAA
jgi:asparagine synthase (glutamine-hydrolysing)